MKKIRSVQLFAFLVLLSSCSAVKIVKEYQEPGTSINNYSTFGFSPPTVEGQVPEGYENRVEMIKTEIAKALTSKGLTQSEHNPDLLLNIGIVIEEKVQTRETDIRTDPPNYIGQRNYTWKSETVEVGRYNEGTVALDFVDNKSKNMIAHYVATSVLLKKDKSALKNIQQGVEKVFNDIQ